jgi:poly(beta-D-mannuronate) lyase
MFKKLLLLIFLGLISFTYAKNINVSNSKELNEAISKAEPGDIIVMKNGTWTNTVINFNSKCPSENPIAISAETPGKVILTGNSKLIIASDFLVVQGLYFLDGALSGTNRDNAEKVIQFAANYCRLRNTVIENYNPKDPSTFYYWVFFSGNNNRLDRCTFIGKNNAGPLIENDYSLLTVGKDSRHNIVDHCCFKNIHFDKTEERSIISVYGYGYNEEEDNDGSYFICEDNLFDHADGDITLRSNYNTVRNNTIKESKGGIVCRNGNFNVIFNNFILGNNINGTTGIVISGKSHQVENNYISEIAGDGLVIMAGEFIDSSLTKNYTPILRTNTKLGRVPRYSSVINSMFANNTFVNIKGKDIVIGKGYKEGWPYSQMILLPENCAFQNNVIQRANKGISISNQVQDNKIARKKFNFQKNIFAANIAYGGDIQIKPLPKGIKIINPLLKLSDDGLYRPVPESPVVGAGIEPLVDEDMDGQHRKTHCDIGADEISQEPGTKKPSTINAVGAQWKREFLK